MTFGFFARTHLLKPSERQAYGTLELGYLVKPVASFQVTANEDDVIINGSRFQLSMADALHSKYSPGSKEMAMASVFSVAIFSPLQKLYDETGEGDGHRVFSNHQRSLNMVEKKSTVFFVTHDRHEIELYQNLIGVRPGAAESNYMTHFYGDTRIFRTPYGLTGSETLVYASPADTSRLMKGKEF